ncbi:MAG: GGDEF domain-containing protein [Betaproteobacteria bacterium]|nr:MAG: GGDEF domain-containing protein [Betaproteobacteria bacterium]
MRVVDPTAIPVSQMNTAALFCTGMAAVAFYAGGYHLVIYLIQHSAVKYLAFAALCASVGLYELFCAGQYQATAMDEGVFWQRLRLESVALITVSVTWLVRIYTARISRAFLKRVAASAAVFVVLSRILPASFTVSVERPMIRELGIKGWFEVTYYQSELGILYLAALTAMLVLYLFLIGCLVAHHRRKRDRETLCIAASQFPLFIAAVNDTLVVAQVYRFIYLAEYAFLFIVVAMSYSSFARFLRLYNALAASNQSLEDKVNERTAQIRLLNEELQRAAEIDGLTGAYNRRFLDRYLEVETRRAIAELKHSNRTESPEPAMNFGLAMFDVDDFKQINDERGHLAGDRVLAAVAETVRSALFERDVFCRYGGEEFVVIFTRTSRRGIIDAAEKLRQAVRAREFDTEPGEPPSRVTISIGVASFADVEEPTPEAILRAADECLLAAKHQVMARRLFRESALSPLGDAVTDSSAAP